MRLDPFDLGNPDGHYLDRDPWAEPPGHRYEPEVPWEGQLRHVVYLDGRFLDTWTEPVEGSCYEPVARAIESRARRPDPPREPTPPLHDRVLAWLDGVVGGRAALLALDEDEQVQLARPAGAGELYDEVLACLGRVSVEHFDEDFRRAVEAALVTLVQEDAALLQEGRGAVDVAAGLVWVVGRANGLVGARTGLTQKKLRQTLWLKSWPSHLTPRYQGVLRGLKPEPAPRPTLCPDLLELGDPAYLTAKTRSELRRLRDRALAATESARGDAVARGEVPDPGVPLASPHDDQGRSAGRQGQGRA